MPRYRRIARLLPSLALAACAEISAPGPLHVTVAARPDTITPGDTMRIDVTIRNVSPRPATFNANCTISFQVRPVRDTTDVANPGPIFCFAFIEEVTLGPFESYRRGFQWNAMQRSCESTTCVLVPVPSGDYRLTGSLNGLLSPAVPLTIR